MYLVGSFTPIIPIAIFVPALTALFLSRIRKEQLFDKRSASLLAGLMIGVFAHQGLVQFLFATRNKSRFLFEKNLLFPSGILLPILFGLALFIIVNRGQLKLFNFSIAGIASSMLYIILSAAPIMLLTSLIAILHNPIFTIPALLIAVLIGFWILFNEEGYNWKFFLVFFLFGVPMSATYIFVVLAFSSM